MSLSPCLSLSVSFSLCLSLSPCLFLSLSLSLDVSRPEVEWIPTSSRTMVGTLSSFFFTFGQLILAGLGYWLRDWRKLQVAVCVPYILFFVYSWSVANQMLRLSVCLSLSLSLSLSLPLNRLIELYITFTNCSNYMIRLIRCV